MSDRQRLGIVALCVDAIEPLGLAQFWADALQWEIVDGSAGAVDLVPTDDTTFPIRFLPGAEQKVGKNPIHLDLTSTSLEDQAESVRRLIELGAAHIDIGQGTDGDHVVLADPDGNELCIIEPGNTFLAGCGRLGSITCAGSRAAGMFWSVALGWPLVWDQDEETAIRASDGTGPFITWGPPVPDRIGRSRLHLDVAPAVGGDRGESVDHLVSLGATWIEDNDTGHEDADRVALADPDGNRLCVVSPR